MSHVIYFTQSGIFFSRLSISLFQRPTPLNVRLHLNAVMPNVSLQVCVLRVRTEVKLSEI
jgi:hypothetical protein